MNLDLSSIRTPAYVIDECLMRRNLQTLDAVQKEADCKIIMALKGFAVYGFSSLIREYLVGTTASSLHEARLGAEEYGGELHVCAPAYSDEDFSELLKIADHIVFNSLSQWQYFKGAVAKHEEQTGGGVQCGLRINPRHSEVKTEKYDPCSKGSRLGITLDEFDDSMLDGISGLHFHTLCELGADALERTLLAVEEQFGPYLAGMKWVNFGVGHHITREGYDIGLLCRLIKGFRQKYGVDVYLEPGEAIALNTGVLVSSVLDVVRNETDIAVLDASASAHMPDVLEMPYRPAVVGASEPGKLSHTYRLAGNTCLAGDVIGDYSFSEPLKRGDKLVFEDMAHYTIVKNTTFNGIRLPSIVKYNSETGDLTVLREFGYDDFKGRLG
jgi:carboxynorspermidine decarboxylase